MTAKARSPTQGKSAAYVQYSKRLATTVTVFWCIFRVACLALLAFRPSLIDGMKNVIQGVDDVMMANIAFYCGNSVAEKGIIGYFGARRQAAEESADDETING
jgi:hypothetical protein